MTRSTSTPIPAVAADASTATTLWAPLANRVFFWLWIATFVSMIGTWLQQVTAAWVMTQMTTSALLISLVQACTLGPMFVLSLPSGALGDVVDRRRLLIAAQLWGACAAGSLAVAAWMDALSPVLLLLGVAGVGVGAAFSGPNFGAIVPELVPRPLIRSAVTLNSVAINLARAIGPALAGALVVTAGPAWAFTFNAVSFFAVITVLVFWKRQPRPSTLPPERFVAAMTTSVSYSRHSPELQAVLLKTTLFIFPASALWALLPVVIDRKLQLDAGAYGTALGALGVGAVAGVFVMQHLRRRVTTDTVIRVSCAFFAVALTASALLDRFALLLPLLLLGGAGWMGAMSTFSSSAQVVLPDWVRARGLSVYTLTFTGSMTLGSVLWGWLADATALPTTLLAAAGTLALYALLMPGRRLSEIERLDLTPSQHQPAGHDVLERGPLPATRVLITVTYDIDPDTADAFIVLMRDVRTARRRMGAFDWNLWADPVQPHRYVESFKSHNWAEHLRQHSRLTNHDRAIIERALAMHRGDEKPVVRHLFAAVPVAPHYRDNPGQ